MTVTLKDHGSFIKVYIDGVLHLSFNQNKYLGMLSYIDSGRAFIVEVHLSDGMMKSEYGSREKWVAVLKVLDEL